MAGSLCRNLSNDCTPVLAFQSSLVTTRERKRVAVEVVAVEVVAVEVEVEVVMKIQILTRRLQDYVHRAKYRERRCPAGWSRCLISCRSLRRSVE